jgi:hypothetical protein
MEIASVVLTVDPAEDKFPWLVVAKLETEDWLRHLTRGDKLVHDRWNMAH